MEPERTVEMTDCGKRGKLNPGSKLSKRNSRKETLVADRSAPAFRLILE
jgi:hypothetical protein